MAESTTPMQCTDAEYNMARDAGLLTATPGTNAFDQAVHRFAEAVRNAAVAPDLLKALELMLMCVDDEGNADQTPFKQARAAIAKATGTLIKQEIGENNV